MLKPQAVTVRVDMKQFFEASVGALQNADDSSKPGVTKTRSAEAQRNSALFRRADATLAKRALADAAKALTTLWKTNLKEAI